MRKFSIATALNFFLTASTSLACMHFPDSYHGNVDQGLQEVFLFHDGTDAHTLIRTRLSAKKFPKEIAWVLPFPSLPSKYEETDGLFFDEISDLFPKMLTDTLGESRAGGQPKASGIKVHKMIQLDSYTIQPIEILKDGSSKELSTWLKKNKFTPMPEKLQKPYLKKGAAFLAIRMQMNHPVPGVLKSKVLHVVYKSDKLSAPVKFTHATRTLDLNIYVFSKTQLKKDLPAKFFNPRRFITYKNEGNIPFVDAILGKNAGYITLYSAENLNKKGKKLSLLKEDPSFNIAELSN